MQGWRGSDGVVEWWSGGSASRQEAAAVTAYGLWTLDFRLWLNLCVRDLNLARKSSGQKQPNMTAKRRRGEDSEIRDSRRQIAMWECPSCQRRFANRNQSHFCGRYALGLALRGKPAAVRKLYELFVKRARRCGPVTIVPEKTRIALQVRMSFAALRLQQTKLVGHLVLAERHEKPCFNRIDSISRHNHVHHFQIANPRDLNREMSDCIRKAYSVGRQEHLKPR